MGTGGMQSSLNPLYDYSVFIIQVQMYFEQLVLSQIWIICFYLILRYVG